MRAQPGRDNRGETQRPGLSQNLQRQETDNMQREREKEEERKGRGKAAPDEGILKKPRMFEPSVCASTTTHTPQVCLHSHAAWKLYPQPSRGWRVKLQTRGRRIKCNTRTITSRRDTAWYTEAIWGRTWARQWARPTCAGTSYAHQIQFIQPLCDLHSKNAHIYFVFTLKKLDELSVEIPSNNYVCVI